MSDIDDSRVSSRERRALDLQQARRISERRSGFAVAGDLAREPSSVDFGRDADAIAKRGTYYSRTVPIVKLDAERRRVTGIVMEPVGTPDSQGDVISASEIEATQQTYMEESQRIGWQHQDDVSDKIKIVESYIAPADMVLGGQAVVKGSWVMTVHVLDDNLWTAVKSGACTGFSIGGTAVRTPLT